MTAAQALLASWAALTEAAPAKNGRKKRQESKKGTEKTKAEKEEKLVETPKAAAAEATELEAWWAKVLDKKKERTQTWNVRSADWTAEVMDVEKLAEGINDPTGRPSRL